MQSSMGGSPTKDCWASDSAKVALSLRDRKRDQQGGVDLPSHLGSTANATRVFSLPVAERQGYHHLTTARTLLAKFFWIASQASNDPFFPLASTHCRSESTRGPCRKSPLSYGPLPDEQIGGRAGDPEQVIDEDRPLKPLGFWLVDLLGAVVGHFKVLAVFLVVDHGADRERGGRRRRPAGRC